MKKVSVIIPAYNATSTLGATLQSVQGQSHRELEIIVVDDGSTDGTGALIAQHGQSDPRIVHLTVPNGGVAKARNTGLERATADWVAPIDADDLWHPRTVERFLHAAQGAADPVTFVYTWSRRIDGGDRILTDLGRPNYQGQVLRRLVATNFTRNASASMIRTSELRAIGGYDPSFLARGAQGAEDIDLYLRLAGRGPVAVAPGFHVGYRQIEGSMSQSADRMRRSIDFALDKAIETHPELPPRLVAVARSNYDLYGAGLAFASGNGAELASYSFKALKRAPIQSLFSLSLLGSSAVLTRYRPVSNSFFLNHDPDKPFNFGVADCVSGFQDLMFGRMFRSGEVSAS